jgi:hypothetical protein
MIQVRRNSLMRPTALLLTVSMLAPFAAGCGGHQNDNVPPPVSDTSSTALGSGPAKKPGMSTGKKVVIALAGAALLYYLYKHHVEQNGQKVQYYKSKKNGRIYYRDPKTHQAHYVTQEQYSQTEVDPEEAKQLQQFKGYNNQASGQDYEGEKDSSGDAA